MGTQQSRSGHGREGSRQQSQQSDHRPPQDRDLQRNKQSDQGEPSGSRSGQQQQSGGSQESGRQPEVQQSQLGGGRDFEHKMENEGREQNREQQNERRQMSQQDAHGEGNYAASRQYNDATRDFTQSGRVEPAARNAAPRSKAEARQMASAEAEGKRHAKGEDPALIRKSSAESPESSKTPRPGHEEE